MPDKPGSLWGARFADGPAPELAALSRSTHFDWQLAPYDIAGSRAHARALAAAGSSTPTNSAGCSPASTRSKPASRDGSFAPGDDDEDVHVALERELIDARRAPSSAASCAPDAAATTRSPP